MSNPQRYNVTAEMMYDAPEPFATLETNEAPDGDWVRAEDSARVIDALQKRLALANRTMRDMAFALADLDDPKARAARIAALRVLDSTDTINPNL